MTELNCTLTLPANALANYKGYYTFGGYMGVSFYLSDKPRFINRLFCRWCLGWRWIDAPTKFEPPKSPRPIGRIKGKDEHVGISIDTSK